MCKSLEKKVNWALESWTQNSHPGSFLPIPSNLQTLQWDLFSSCTRISNKEPGICSACEKISIKKQMKICSGLISIRRKLLSLFELTPYRTYQVDDVKSLRPNKMLPTHCKVLLGDFNWYDAVLVITNLTTNIALVTETTKLAVLLSWPSFMVCVNSPIPVETVIKVLVTCSPTGGLTCTGAAGFWVVQDHGGS